MKLLKLKIKHHSSFNFPSLWVQGRGNSLVEYALPLALVGLLIFMGFESFSPSLQRFVKGGFNASGGNGANERVLTLRPIGSNPYTGAVTLTLRDGSQIEVIEMPRDLKGLVETLGPNGATDLLANAIHNLAKSLLAAGKITQDEANQLSALANNGHSLAFNQSVLLDLAQNSGGSTAVYKQKSDPIIAERYQSQRLIKELDPLAIQFFGLKPQTTGLATGADGKFLYVNGDIKGDMVTDSNRVFDAKIGADQFAFYNTFARVMKTSLYQEPAVKSVLGSLVVSIHLLANSSFSYSGRAADEAYSLSPDKISSIVADSIHRDSGNICSVGGGKDSGIYCPGQK
ncbi:MAG: hypothetical protein K2X66_09430 [Cyanobacteria bacterium]|nr:hypothetical protein [Cyanobacteriota bacterium]